MGIFILGVIVGVCFALALRGGRGSHGLEGDLNKEPKPPTRVVRPGEHGGYTPNCPTVDWAKVQKPTGSAVRPPGPTGIIPGRPGQEVNSGGDTFIPPLRPDPPRTEDRHYQRPGPNPRLKDRG